MAEYFPQGTGGGPVDRATEAAKETAGRATEAAKGTASSVAGAVKSAAASLTGALREAAAAGERSRRGRRQRRCRHCGRLCWPLCLCTLHASCSSAYNSIL